MAGAAPRAPRPLRVLAPARVVTPVLAADPAARHLHRVAIRRDLEWFGQNPHVIEARIRPREWIEPVGVHEIGDTHPRPVPQPDLVDVGLHWVAELHRVEAAARVLGPLVRRRVTDERAALV